MRAAGIRPRSVVISQEDLGQAGVDAQAAEHLMRYQGHIGVADGVQTLVGPLPSGARLVVAADAGVYLRCDDHLGVMAYGANRNFVMVS
jgi:hypothetical protein